MQNKNSDLYFLRGGGKMGELIREKDWSNTPLGEPATWPQSLRTMVGVMLDNPFGMYIAWGSEYIQLYNDGYRPILGLTKHPQALGISTQETFSEIWDIIGPMFAGVMGGKAVGFPDLMLPLNRNGFVEECFFDFSYSPIRKDNGEVGGILVTVIETTEKKKISAALTESNSRYINNILQAPVAMCIFRGKDHVVEIANEHMLRLWGKEATEVMNKPIFEGLPEAKNQGLEELIDTVFATGEKFVANERPVDLPRNGKVETTYVNFVYDALRESDGTISGIIAIAVEVTEQVEAREKTKESHELFRNTMQQAPVGITILRGEDFIAEMANDAYLHIVDKRENNFIGKPLFSILPELKQQIKPLLDKVLKTGEPFHGNEMLITLNRCDKFESCYVDTLYYPLKDDHGKITGVIASVTDVSEKVAAKKNVEEKKRLYETITQNTPDLIYVFDLQYRFTYANEALLKMWGRTWEESVGKGMIENGYETWHAEMHIKEIDQVIASKKAIRGEVSFTHATLGKRIYDYIFSPIIDQDGNVEAIAGTTRDITPLVQYREQVEESEQRFQAAIAAVQGILWTNSARGEMEGVQEAWSSLTGQSYEEYCGYGWSRALHPDDVRPTLDAWNDAVNKRKMFVFEHRVRTKDGTYKDFSVRAIPLINADGTLRKWVGVHTDITQNNKAAKTLKENEEKLTVVIEASELGTWEIDVKTKNIIASERYSEIMGLTGKNKLSLSDTVKRIHPDHIQLWEDAIKNAYETGRLFFSGQIIWEDNSSHWIEKKGKVFYDKKNNPHKIIGTTSDITQIKEQQQILSESEHKFRLLADSMPQHIWTSDPEGTLNYFNQSVMNYSGLTLEQILREGWLNIIHPDDKEENIRQWQSAIATGNDFLVEHRFLRYDGQYRWQLSRAIPQRDENGKIQMWVGTSTDIQEQKIREEKKDEFISIASHEMKTPLTTAKGYLQMLEIVLDEENEEGNLYAKKASQSVNRLNELISELLDVSKIRLGKLNYTITNFDFNEMIRTAVESVQLTSQSHTILQTGTMNGLVKGDADRLQQVVINLLTNAIKYSPDADNVQLNLEQQNDTVTVSVKDTGIGIAQQSLNKIFDKYYRVEEHAVNFQGLGVGLFISYEIIQRHDGKLWAESEPGKGSTFYFTIPLQSKMNK